MVDNIKFLIPNLFRRPDRWQWCRDSLILAGVPRREVVRVFAYDSHYYYHHSDYDLTKIHFQLKNDFGNPLPPFLSENTGSNSILGDGNNCQEHTIAEYAWDATWYKCLSQISILPHKLLGMILIDDNTITISYPELLKRINNLATSLSKQWRRILAIQISRDHTDDPEENYQGVPVTGAPFFQTGFAATNDCAIVYTPIGARLLLSRINQLATCNIFIDPFLTVAYIKKANVKHGFYAPTHNQAPLTRFAKSKSLNFSKSNPAITDREQPRRTK